MFVSTFDVPFWLITVKWAYNVINESPAEPNKTDADRSSAVISVVMRWTIASLINCVVFPVWWSTSARFSRSLHFIEMWQLILKLAEALFIYYTLKFFVSEITSTLASLRTVFSLRHFISAPDSSCVLSAVAYFMFVLVSCQYNSVKMPRGRHDEVLIFISLCVSFSIWKDNSESCLFESRVYSRWDRKQVRVRMAVPETHIV